MLPAQNLNSEPTRQEDIMIGSIPDLAIIVILGLVLFGAKNIPELGKNLGRGLREFKSGLNDLKSEIESTLPDKPQPVQVVTSKTNASISAPNIETSGGTTFGPTSAQQ
jgi:sec-independent protein translocase protein TatA